jgi:hypothetical protein
MTNPYDRPLLAPPPDVPPVFSEPPQLARDHWPKLEQCMRSSMPLE